MIRRFVTAVLAAVFSLAQITVAPEILQHYVGAYRMGPGTMTITLEGGQLLSQITGQRKLPLVAQSENTFAPEGIKATIEFPKDSGRPAQQLILHQNGRDITAERLDEAEIRKIRDKTPGPDGESAVRRMVTEILAGKPSYDLMSERLGNATRQQLPQLRSMFGDLGSLQSVIFKDVSSNGMDIYQVNFEKGAMDYLVVVGDGGKVERAALRPTQYPRPTASVESLKPKLAEIDAIVGAELAQRPVGSVTAGVVVGKQLIWSKSYGDADIGKKIAADTDTVYRIGSITKMFTALMLEQLVESGKVHLSDPVEKYLPEIKTVRGRYPDAPPITLMQLATHTSGLAREPDDNKYLAGPVADWEKILIAALPHLKYELEPGTRFLYSNMGFAILGAALSRAAGEPYVEYVPKHIFAALGMTHTALERNAAMQAHLAKGYEMRGQEGDATQSEKEHETGRGYKVPNGAVYTTVGDMAHFASFLMGEGPESVLKSKSLDLFQKQMIVPADVDLQSGYGIGFMVRRKDNYVSFGHGGSVAGYTAMLEIDRAKGIAVIVLSNGAANPNRIADRTMDSLVK